MQFDLLNFEHEPVKLHRFEFNSGQMNVFLGQRSGKKTKVGKALNLFLFFIDAKLVQLRFSSILVQNTFFLHFDF